MINKNLQILEKRICNACLNAGRDRSEVTLIAVSKYNPISAITEAVKNGIIHFGENRAQEFSEKAELIKENICWHFIGHLQTNKVKNVVQHAEFIHSVESEKLIAEIDRRAANIDKIQKVLLEVKTSGEESKFGLMQEKEIFKLAEFCKSLSNVNLVGLMTMAPYSDDQGLIKNCFGKLKAHFENLNSKGFNLTELSMGMTNDLEIAIAQGSTMLRVGTAIFGERDYNKSWKEQ